MSDRPDETTTQTTSDANLLFDRDMEEALIGSVLITPDAYVDAAPLVNAEDFYLHRNRWIWEAFIELFKTDNDFDVLTVKDALETGGHLEDIGGLDYLISLTNRVPSSQHAESYARNINALAVRRRLLTAATTSPSSPTAKTLEWTTSFLMPKKPFLGSARNATNATWCRLRMPQTNTSNAFCSTPAFPGGDWA